MLDSTDCGVRKFVVGGIGVVFVCVGWVALRKCAGASRVGVGAVVDADADAGDGAYGDDCGSTLMFGIGGSGEVDCTLWLSIASSGCMAAVESPPLTDAGCRFGDPDGDASGVGLGECDGCGRMVGEPVDDRTGIGGAAVACDAANRSEAGRVDCGADG